MGSHPNIAKSVRISLLVAAVFAVALAPASNVTAQAGSGFTYEIHIDCPQRGDGLPVNDIFCPVQAIDEQDIMGSPSVAVDPEDPNHIILASLHGDDGDGPTERSRGLRQQPFTTFISYDHGGSWQDNPFFPPRSLSGSYGEHPQASIDKFGHVYIGSLYSTPDDGAPTGYYYTIVAQKFEDIWRADARATGTGDYGAQFIDTFYDGNIVDQFWFLYDNETDVTTLVWNERLPDTDSGLATNPKARSVIGMAWTTPKGSDPYRYVDEDYLIGPCAMTTNPVLSEGKIYIGCMVNDKEAKAKGYPYDDSPVEGQIDMFRVALKSGKHEYLGTAPLAGGVPKLGVRSDGRVALFTTSAGAPDERALKLFGVYGQAKADSPTMHWGPSHSYGDVVSPPTQGLRVVETNIQDIMYRELTGVVHLIIKERYENLGINLNDLQATLKPQFAKYLVAIDEEHGALDINPNPPDGVSKKRISFDIGNPLNRTSLATDPTNPEGVFNDLTDDLLQLPPGPLPPGWEDRLNDTDGKYQREFFAVGDYGIVIFAEIIEISDLRTTVVPLVQSVPAIVTPSLATAGIGVGIAGAALAGLLALKLALNKTKSHAAAVSKGGK
jgi:hypothetical protein